MKVIKYICCCLIIMIVLIIIILIQNNKKIKEFNGETQELTVNSEIIEEENFRIFMSVEKCIQKYLESISEKNEEKILNLLDTNYIDKNGINTRNLFEKIQYINNYNDFKVENMYEQQQDLDIFTFIVEGKITYEQDSQNKNEEIILGVNVEMGSMAFSIYPNYNYKNIKLENLQISENSHNKFELLDVAEDELIGRYFENYKDAIVSNDIEKAYNYLDDEYRKKRFGDINEYGKYIENINMDEFKDAFITLDYIKSEADYTEYICSDFYGNSYVIRETALMKYKIMLDTYTIDLPNFIEKYNTSATNQKVAFNILKIMQAIAAEDYGYIYSHLDNDFKQNFFETEEQLKEYIKNNFFKYNIIQFDEFKEIGDTYTYDIIMTDRLKESEEQKKKTIIMKLLEGTDFVMSFNVE